MIKDQHIEWKESWRDEYLKWVCAFANAQGGVLEIGRDSKGKVVGLPDAAKLIEDLPNKMRDLLGIVADVDLREEAGAQRRGLGPVPAGTHGQALGYASMSTLSTQKYAKAG